MKLSNKLISFNIEREDGNNIFGFKVFNTATAKQFLKAVKLLENNNSQLLIGNDSFEYSTQNFQVTTISNAELKIIDKFFEVEFDNNQSNQVGSFPNAIEDAYDEGLLDEEQQNDQQNDEYDQQY